MEEIGRWRTAYLIALNICIPHFCIHLQHMIYIFMVLFAIASAMSYKQQDYVHHYSDVTRELWRFKSAVPRVFAQQLVYGNIKQNIDKLHKWPLFGESNEQRWISLKKEDSDAERASMS